MISDATTFDSIARQLCVRLGWPYSTVASNQLTTEQWLLLRSAVSDALKWAWEAYWWPDLMHTCRVQLRPSYSASTTYTAGSEVLFDDSDGYYVCLQACTGQAPATFDGEDWNTNYTYWAAVDESGDVDAGEWDSGSVDYALGDRVTWHGDTYACILANTSSTILLPSNATYWATVPEWTASLSWSGLDTDGNSRPVIGRMQSVTASNALNYSASTEYEFLTTSAGLVFPNLTVTRPWITYRVRCPELTGDPWDEDTAYTAETADRAVWGQ